jgi:DNA polymerase lambda
MNNDEIIGELLETSEYYDSIGDEGRCRAYKRAIESIKEYGRPITSGEQAKQLKWIGDGIGAKIDTILGNKANRHEYKKMPPRKVAVTLIDDIRKGRTRDVSPPPSPKKEKPKRRNNRKTGTEIAEEKRKQYVNRSSRTLRVKQYEYTPKPDTDATVVSRAELEQFINCVRKSWEKLNNKVSSQAKYSCKIEACGAFRRGKTMCHECVIVLKSNIGFQRQKRLFKQLIELLYKVRLIETKNQRDTGLYVGILDISRLFRSQRTGKIPDKPANIPVVLRLVEPEAWACALLRWTGPKSYWIKLKSAAQHQNYALTETGLYHRGKRLYHRDEFDVMLDLDMGYLEPIYRK